MSYHGPNCDFCEQAHVSGACLPASLGLSEEHVKYMGTYTKHQRNPCFNTYNYSLKKHCNLSWGNNNDLQPTLTMQQSQAAHLNKKGQPLKKLLLATCKLHTVKLKR